MAIKKALTAIIFILLVVAGFFYFRFQVYYFHNNYAGEKMFEIAKGESNEQIAGRLKSEGLISGKIYFYYYIHSHKLTGRIMPGEYQLSGSMAIPEIAGIITNVEEKFTKITFPEGWTAKQMAERLSANSLPGDEFMELVNNPENFKNRYSYLANIKNLEGYLFPDTYFFKKDISAENIVGRLLDTFDEKLNNQLKEDISGKNKSISDIVIMASIVEKEVQTSEDMKIASGIFYNRIKNGQRLESDATLSYVLDDNEDQHSGKDLELDSPYNTYRNSGLPPGPIANPGINALNAAVYPEQTDYNYFLTATVNGEKKVFYAKTYEEHLANKKKYGL